MTLYEKFEEFLEKWVDEEYKEKYPNSYPDDEARVMYQEGLDDNFVAELKEQGMSIENVDDTSDLLSRLVVYKLTEKEETTHVCFFGWYESYQSNHPYEGYKEVIGKEVTKMEWE